MSQTVTFTLDGANLYSAFRGARLVKSANTSIPSTGTLFLPWETVDRDTGGNSWAAANPTKLVCTEAGNVIVRACILWQHAGAGQGIVIIKKNGIGQPGLGRYSEYFSTTGLSSFNIISGAITVQAGDFFELQITNNTAINLDIVFSPYTWFEIQYAEGVRGPVGASGPVGPSGQTDLSTRVQSLMNPGITSMGTYSQAYVMQDGTVKTSGKPNSGNLGSGNYENSHTRAVPLAFDNPAIGPVKSVYQNTHGGHIITVAGEVWGWGLNNLGQVGDGSQPITRYRPVPVNWTSYTPPRMVKLACTTRDEYSYNNDSAWYGLDDAGCVWSWGNNSVGQLAIGNTTVQNAPYKTNISGVVDIEASGGTYGAVFAVKGDGTVFSAGYNYTGLLGYAYTGTNVMSWKQVNLPGPCIKVRSTGSYHGDGYSYGHTLFLLADGRVFASGYNGYGQCGDGTNTNINGDPKEISFISNIVDVWAAGALYGQSFAVNANGDFFVWGINGYGQLGTGTTANENRPKPHPVKHVTSVKVGGWGSCNHSVLLTQSGVVYTSGNNAYGQLGQGSSDQPPTDRPANCHNRMLLPQGVQGSIVEICACGYSNGGVTQLLDSNGHVWICGINTNNQLGANPSFGDRHTMATRVMF